MKGKEFLVERRGIGKKERKKVRKYEKMVGEEKTFCAML